MAQKKTSVLMEELKNADLMTILSGGGTSKVFEKNDMIDYSYSTGIPIIDSALAYEIIVKDNGQFVKRRICKGIQAGSFNVLTGNTQSYKSTILLQMEANIAFSNDGNVVHYDAENRLVVQRVKNLTKLNDDWFDGDFPRFKLRCGAIGYDTLQSDITEIYYNKMKHKDLLLRDTGEVDHLNRPIMLMPPTIVGVDSISDVIAKEYSINDKNFLSDMGELRNNADGMRNAKTLRGLLTDILPMMKEANIILFVIAHKGSNAAMSAFQQPAKQFQYGKHDEKISGGKALEYGCSALLNLTAEISAESRYTIEKDGFAGNTVLFEPIKASTNESGNDKTGLGFEIVIDKRGRGVDNVRSLILFLNSKNRLKGNKAGYYVLDNEGNTITEKFTWKNVYEFFEKDPVAYKKFMITAKEELDKLLATATNDAGTINPMDLDKICEME